MIDIMVEIIKKKLLCMKSNNKQWENLIQFIRFGVVGLSNTIISYVIYITVLIGLQKLQLFKGTDYLIAQFVGFIISVLWSFYWNNKVVFKKKEGESRNYLLSLAKTYASYAFTGLFMNSVLSMIWVEVLGWSKLIAPIINLLISVPLNFILNKFWAFES